MYHLEVPKTRTALDLAFEGPDAGATLHLWLYEQIRAAILDGRLKRGAKLPPTRDLATHYGLSRGTAVAAFELLRSEGYLEGRMGAGTFVNLLLPEDFSTAKRNRDRRANAAAQASDLFQIRQPSRCGASHAGFGATALSRRAGDRGISPAVVGPDRRSVPAPGKPVPSLRQRLSWISSSTRGHRRLSGRGAGCALHGGSGDHRVGHSARIGSGRPSRDRRR